MGKAELEESELKCPVFNQFPGQPDTEIGQTLYMLRDPSQFESVCFSLDYLINSI